MRPVHTIKAILYRSAVGAFTFTTLPSIAQEIIEDVVVTATRIPRSVHDIAGTVSVISQEDIEQQIAEDLDDLVRYQPGISMDTAGRGGNQGFIIRGIGGNRVLTVIDGVRSNDQYMAGPSSYGKDAYEVDDLKAVEVIRGPASVLYGADAMGGAVILTSKGPFDYLDGDETSFLGARLSGSSADGRYKFGFTGAIRHGDGGALVQYTAREFAEPEISGDGELNPIDGSSHALLVKTTLDVNEDHRLTLGFDQFDETVDSALNTDLGRSVSSSLGTDETERRRLSLRHGWQSEGVLADSLESQVYWQTNDGLQHTTQRRTSFSFLNPFDPSSYGGTEATRSSDLEFNQEVRGLSVVARKEWSSDRIGHSLVYGLMLEETDTERPRNRCETRLDTGASACSISPYPFAPPEIFPNKTFPDTRTTRQGFFIQDEIVLGRERRFTLIPGLRHDRYEMDPSNALLTDVSAFGYDVVPVREDDVSTNLGVIYDLSDRLALVAQYAEGFRPPNFDESNQAFVNRAFGYATVPNPDLRPETSKGVELGLKANFDRARYTVAVYRNDYRDFIDSQVVGFADGVSFFQDRNIGTAQIDGLELTGQWMVTDNWLVHGALAYARGDDEENDTALNSVDPLTTVVRARFTEPNDRWSIETLLTLVAAKNRVSADDRVTADAYQVVDVIGHYRLTESSSLRLGVYNLFDETYASWANIQGLDAADVDTIARAQAPGTYVRASFNIDF